MSNHDEIWGPSRGTVGGRPVEPNGGPDHPDYVPIPPLKRPEVEIQVATLREEGIDDRCAAPDCDSIDIAVTMTRAVCLRCNWQGTPTEAIAAATSYKATLKNRVVQVGPARITLRELAGTGRTKEAAVKQLTDLVGRAVAQAYLAHKNGGYAEQEIARAMEIGSE